MNYIKRLETENAELRQRAESSEKEICDFLAFCLSSKFVGTDANGQRKDWISIADVQARLMEIKGQIKA